MTFPLIDFSDLFSVTNVEFDASAKYSITAENGRPIRIREISLGFTSGFLTDGRAKITLMGRIITSQNSAENEIDPISNFTIRFDDDDIILMQANETLEVEFRAPGGVGGDVQVLLTATEMTQQEADVLLARARKLGA